MPDIRIIQPHQLSHKEAKAAAQKIAEKLVENFAMTIVWEGDHFSFTRSGASGTLTVSEAEARMEVVLGAFFKMFAGTIEEQITQNMNKAFSGTA